MASFESGALRVDLPTTIVKSDLPPENQSRV
jgi:hypothetical protein